MPTGYTDPLYRGQEISFEQFVLRCSRAMGAAIRQRDNSPDEEIVEIQASEHIREWAAKSKADLDAARARSLPEWADQQLAAHAARVAAMRESLATRGALRARYEAMLSQVSGWTPPTAEHQGLKDFMVQQLQDSIRFDCARSSWDDVPSMVTPDEFRAREIARLEERAGRDEELWAEELDRVERQNAWVRALRQSLEVRA